MKKWSRQSWMAWCYAATILVSAFLVFQVQPIISKTILPWFGGSPAVWTTCMLFFQVVLFGGYAYAHLLTRLQPAQQGLVHFLLVTTSLLVLPITPDASWKPTGAEDPTFRIIGLLLLNVGMPYFLLSSTGPLIQAWFSRTCEGESPYRLYALSNVGSLAALLTYPLANFVMGGETFTIREGVDAGAVQIFISSILGLVSGLAPARQATEVDPSIVLRST